MKMRLVIMLLCALLLSACQPEAQVRPTRTPQPTPAPPSALSDDEVLILTAGNGRDRVLTAYNMTTDTQRVLIDNVRDFIGDGGFAEVPVRSPDGTQLAAARQVVRDIPGGFTTDNAGIWVAALDGTDKREVAVPEGNAEFSDPAWSPDGTRIAFTASKFGGSLMVVDLASGEVTPLLPEGTYGRNVSWSPDGTKVAYNDDRRDSENVLTRGIYVYDLASATESPVYVEIDVNLLAVAWSPDSQRLTFIRDAYKEGLQEVYVVNLDGSDLQNMTPGQAYAYDPQFAPDGATIAFNDYDSETKTYHLAVLTLDGSGERVRKLQLPGNRSGPQWE